MGYHLWGHTESDTTEATQQQQQQQQDSSTFIFLRSLHTVFCSARNQFTFSTVHKGSLFSSPSSPTFMISYLFDKSHSNRCEVIPHCGLDLYFPDVEWC